MLDEQFLLLSQGDNLRFCDGHEDLRVQGTGWFVNPEAQLPATRPMLMVTAIESQGSLSPIRVGSVISVIASQVELVV